jgi:hypothetical protein
VLEEWPRAARPQAIELSFDFTEIANATQVRITIRDPLGREVVRRVCEDSPCGITVPDSAIGTHLIRREYLDADGAVVSESEWQPLPVR